MRRLRHFPYLTHHLSHTVERNPSGSLDAALARASEFAEEARNSICSFPDSEIKRALLWVPESVVAREK